MKQQIVEDKQLLEVSQNSILSTKSKSKQPELGELVNEVQSICENLETVDVSFLDKIVPKKQTEPEVKPSNNIKLPPKPFKEDSDKKKKKNSERKRSSSKNKIEEKKEEIE